MIAIRKNITQVVSVPLDIFSSLDTEITLEFNELGCYNPNFITSCIVVPLDSCADVTFYITETCEPEEAQDVSLSVSEYLVIAKDTGGTEIGTFWIKVY